MFSVSGAKKWAGNGPPCPIAFAACDQHNADTLFWLLALLSAMQPFLTYRWLKDSTHLCSRKRNWNSRSEHVSEEPGFTYCVKDKRSGVTYWRCCVRNAHAQSHTACPQWRN